MNMYQFWCVDTNHLETTKKPIPYLSKTINVSFSPQLFFKTSTYEMTDSPNVWVWCSSYLDLVWTWPAIYMLKTRNWCYCRSGCHTYIHTNMRWWQFSVRAGWLYMHTQRCLAVSPSGVPLPARSTTHTMMACCELQMRYYPTVLCTLLLMYAYMPYTPCLYTLLPLQQS